MLVVKNSKIRSFHYVALSSTKKKCRNIYQNVSFSIMSEIVTADATEDRYFTRNTFIK